MKLFLDTADIEEIKTVNSWGVLDGVTTNPTLFAKVGGSYDDVLKQICDITSGPVSAEVIAEDVAQAFLHQALELKTTADVTTVDGGNIAAALR